MHKYLSTPASHILATEKVIIGMGISGIIEALDCVLSNPNSRLVLIDSGLPAPSRQPVHLHTGGEYPLDRLTQQYCFLSTVAMYAIISGIFLLRTSESLFAVSKETEFASPGSAHALQNCMDNLQRNVDTLFKTFEQDCHKLQGEAHKIARDLITLLEQKLLLPGGKAFEKRPLTSTTLFSVTLETLFSTPQETMQGNMFIEFAIEFLKSHASVTILEHTTALGVEGQYVYTSVGVIKTNAVTIADGHTYPPEHAPEGIKKFVRGMVYTQHSSNKERTQGFLVPDENGAMLDTVSSSTKRMYGPNRSCSQISTEKLPPSRLNPLLIPTIEISKDQLQSHAEQTTQHGKNHFKEPGVPEVFPTYLQYQHRGASLEERPFVSPAKWPNETMQVKSVVSNKFSHAVLNIMHERPSWKEEWGSEHPSFEGLLKALVEMRTLFGPFIAFCHVEVLGENRARMEAACTQKGTQQGLPEKACWNYDFDPENRGRSILIRGDFKDILNKNWEKETPLIDLWPEFKNENLTGVFALSHLNGKGVANSKGIFASSVRDSVLITRKIDPLTDTSVWGQMASLKTHTVLHVQEEMPLSALIAALKNQATESSIPIGFEIECPRAIEGLRGQIFIPTTSTVSKGEDHSGIGVKVAHNKFVCSLTKDQLGASLLSGFVNPQELFSYTTNGSSEVHATHSHLMIRVNAPDKKVAGRCHTPSGESFPYEVQLQSENQDVVFHALSDYIVPAGTVVRFNQPTSK